MIVFEVLYCSCIYESASATISIHSTREGAESAMNKHRENEKKEWNEMYDVDEREHLGEFDAIKSWAVRETEVNEL